MIPTFHFIEIATSNDESAKAAAAENASRIAVVEVQQESKGIGQHRLPKPIIFPVVFRTEPHFTSGCATVSRIHDGLYHDPRGSSGVYAWKRDAKGYYTGAYCWLRVDIEAISSAAYNTLINTEISAVSQILKQAEAAKAADYRRKLSMLKQATGVKNLDKIIVEHYLTFSAVAIKALPTKTLTAALNPRTVGI